jgi:fumarylacetoacetate (FAA) hydrolase
MKLATLRDGSRDGALVVVDRALRKWISAVDVAPTLQVALDNWPRAEPALRRLSEELESGERKGTPLDFAQLAAPLPRAYAWLDGSVYLNHMELARRLRGVDMPRAFREVPLMYEGISSLFLACRDDLVAPPGDVGLDLEGEIAVILDDVPQGTKPDAAAGHIKLLTLVNDVTLRTVFAEAAAQGYFPTLHGKPPCSMAAVAVTPDELGAAWDGRMVNLRLRCKVNETLLGEPHAGRDYFFDFPALIAHAARYRPLGAGTVLGSGTVSNYDRAAGAACIAERRMREQAADGAARMPYLAAGDEVHIETLDDAGRSVFGALHHKVIPFQGEMS